jgi:hypothetical protein
MAATIPKAGAKRKIVNPCRIWINTDAPQFTFISLPDVLLCLPHKRGTAAASENIRPGPV